MIWDVIYRRCRSLLLPLIWESLHSATASVLPAKESELPIALMIFCFRKQWISLMTCSILAILSLRCSLYSLCKYQIWFMMHWCRKMTASANYQSRLIFDFQITRRKDITPLMIIMLTRCYWFSPDFKQPTMECTRFFSFSLFTHVSLK